MPVNVGFKVWINATAEGGKANVALTEILSHHLKIKKKQIEIKKGATSRQKWIAVHDAL